MGILSQHALNRALIERQMLRERADLGAFATIERLVGIQAQEPKSPYLGLWTRLQNFRPQELEDLLVSRHVVRILLMRGTIHLVSAQDALALRPHMQLRLDRELQSGPFAKRLKGLDLDEVADAGRKILEDEPQGTADAGKREEVIRLDCIELQGAGDGGQYLRGRVDGAPLFKPRVPGHAHAGEHRHLLAAQTWRAPPSCTG